jgi:mono/diheme cytochrome c family protein
MPLLSPLLVLVLASPAPQASDARALFIANCAACHGESGDGKGTTQLDRPARSFMDGGFSFGNTPEALFRTISIGIPGTPMAGFDASLSEAERKLLADYVVTLGPPIEAVAEEDMILAVHDRPLVVRGLLPPLAEGLPSHPRGLLIGDLSGITFQYRVDDVRLLALRQGGFVKRTDWSGRGGTALEPLGKVVHLVSGGKPEATFHGGSDPLTARLSGTLSIDGGKGFAIEYHLLGAQGEVAHVREIPQVLTTPFGTGYQRTFVFHSGGTTLLLARTPLVDGASVLADGEHMGERWQVVRAADGPPVFFSLDQGVAPKGSQLEATLHLRSSEASALMMMVLVLTDWNDGIRAQVEQWFRDL